MLSWQAWLLSHEVELRLGCFVSIFILMAVWEYRSPCRKLKYPRILRWSNNLALVALNSVLLRFIFPAAAVGVAYYAQEQGWGLFNLLGLPTLLEVILVVVALDLLIYFQHRLVHSVPLLWRLHRVHHVDPDYDVTTGSRFHPLEIIFSMLIKFAAVLLLGAPVVAVILFEVILNGSAMFNHSNIRLPASVERILRKVLVTPDMHRVHHSTVVCETNSNYGFALSVWDRLFHTYQDQPKQGHVGMDIGLTEFRSAKDICRLDGMLLLPFRDK